MLSAVFLLIGVLILFGKGTLLCIPKVDGSIGHNVTRSKRLAVGGVLVFVGLLLSATTYSIVAKDNPYWFIDNVFQMFT